MTIRCWTLAVLLAGCLPGELGSQRQAVVGGAATPDELDFPIDRFQRNAVAGMLYGGSSQGCSGTLVGDQVVISAAHCVVANQTLWEAGAPAKLIPADQVSLAFGNDISTACKIGAKEISIHPEATVTPDGIIVHDVSLTILQSSALATCPDVVPIQINRDPITADLVEKIFLQGGFGSLDYTYRFSTVRYWSLAELTGIADDYVATIGFGHGGPSFGDSGSGLLYRFPDGSLRTIGIDSLGGGIVSSFVRVDHQASFFDQAVSLSQLCGTVTAAGICKDTMVVACHANGFTTLDCAASGKTCAVDPGGTASCTCACDTTPGCDPGCACDPQCVGLDAGAGEDASAPAGPDASLALDASAAGPDAATPGKDAAPGLDAASTCACDKTPGCDPGCECDPQCQCEMTAGGCASAPGGSSAGAAVPLALLALGLWGRRMRRLLAVLLSLAVVLVGCGGSTVECHQRDAGLTPEVDASFAGPDAAAPGPDAAVPGPDAAVAGPDASIPLDAATVEQDAATSEPDAAALPDASYVTDGGCTGVADLLNPLACGPEGACDIADFIANTVGCRLAGTTAAYAACSVSTSSCVPGTSCMGFDQNSLVCAPFCDIASQTPVCPGAGVCALEYATTLPIGLCFVPDNCDLVSKIGCKSGKGCYLLSDQSPATFCYPAGKLGDGQPCESSTDCRNGWGCLPLSPDAGTTLACRRWCRLDTDCTSPATCHDIGATAGHPDLGRCE